MSKNQEIYKIINNCLLEAILSGGPLTADFRVGEINQLLRSEKEEEGSLELSLEVPFEIVCDENSELSYDEINNSIIKKWIVVNSKDVSKRLTAVVNRYLNTMDLGEEYNWDVDPSVTKASLGRIQSNFYVEIDNEQKKVRFLITMPALKGMSNSK